MNRFSKVYIAAVDLSNNMELSNAEAMASENAYESMFSIRESITPKEINDYILQETGGINLSPDDLIYYRKSAIMNLMHEKMRGVFKASLEEILQDSDLPNKKEVIQELTDSAHLPVDINQRPELFK